MEEQKMKTSIHFSIERGERAKILEELKYFGESRSTNDDKGKTEENTEEGSGE